MYPHPTNTQIIFSSEYLYIYIFVYVCTYYSSLWPQFSYHGHVHSNGPLNHQTFVVPTLNSLCGFRQDSKSQQSVSVTCLFITHLQSRTVWCRFLLWVDKQGIRWHHACRVPQSNVLGPQGFSMWVPTFNSRFLRTCGDLEGNKVSWPQGQSSRGYQDYFPCSARCWHVF